MWTYISAYSYNDICIHGVHGATGIGNYGRWVLFNEIFYELRYLLIMLQTINRNASLPWVFLNLLCNLLHNINSNLGVRFSLGFSRLDIYINW